MRVGMGYDVHKLVEGRDLILGGVKIPHTLGLWDIRMQMFCCMQSWMHCLVRLPLVISENISRIRIRSTKDFEYQIIRACYKTDRGKRIYCGEYRRNDHCTETENASVH